MNYFDSSPYNSIDLFGGSERSYQPPEPQPYQDPYASYENPYASYENPYADFSSPFSDIDLFSAQRGGMQQPAFGMAPPPASMYAQFMQGQAPQKEADDTMYAGGTPGFDERTGQYTGQMPPGPQGGIASISAAGQPVDQPTFFAGDQSFGTRQEALDYARNELEDPDAVQFVGAGQTRAPQLTAEERRAIEERRLEGLRRFEENRQRVEEFKARKQGLIDQYSGRDVEGGFGLEGRGFENVRFRDLDEAMAALRGLNAPGADPNNLAVSYDRLVNMGGGPMFTVTQGVNQNRLDVPRFTNRDDAIAYLMQERGLDRARASRSVQQRN